MAQTAGKITFDWKPLPAPKEGLTVKSVACGDRDSIVCLTDKGSIYQLDEKQTWNYLKTSETATDVDIGLDSEIWFVDSSNHLWVQVQGQFIRVSGDAKSVSCACRNRLMVTAKSGEIWKLPLTAGNWTKMPSAGNTKRCATGADGEQWYLNKNGELYRFVNESWVRWDGIAVGITVMDKDNVYHFNKDGDVWKLQEGASSKAGKKGSSWSKCSTPAAASFAIGADGTAVYCDKKGNSFVAFAPKD